MAISVQKVTNFVGSDKKPSNMFIVSVDRDHFEKLYKITRVLNFTNKIEILKPLRSVIQCHWCLRFGYESLHCQMQLKSVKSGQNHTSYECSVKKSSCTTSKCLNWVLDHSALRKGCIILKIPIGAKIKSKISRDSKRQFSSKFTSD